MINKKISNSIVLKLSIMTFPFMFLLFSTNCVPIKKQRIDFKKFPEITDVKERIELVGFSFLPPQESNWRIAFRKHNTMVLVRETVALSHSIMAISRMLEIKHYSKDPEIFLKQRVNEHFSSYNSEKRYSDLRMGRSVLKFRGTDCIYISITVTDREVPGFKGINHDLNIDEILCYHKYDRNYLIMFSFSERVTQGNTPYDAKRIVKGMVRSVKFDKI